MPSKKVEKPAKVAAKGATKVAKVAGKAKAKANGEGVRIVQTKNGPRRLGVIGANVPPEIAKLARDVKNGNVLKAAFPKLDAADLKVMRRRMRAAMRAASPEGKVLAAHKIGGGRWLLSDAMRKAALAVYEGGKAE